MDFSRPALAEASGWRRLAVDLKVHSSTRLRLVIRACAVGVGLTAASAGVWADEMAPVGDASGSGIDDEFQVLPVLDVIASTEGQEIWPEEEPDPFPFGSQSLFASLVADRQADEVDFGGIGEQVLALNEDRSTEFATVSGAAAPRGFATPRLRNGFAQSAFPEIIIGGRRELLTGFLATYYGRTAPGGILNTISRRPAPKPAKEFEVRGSSVPSVSFATDSSFLIGARTRSGKIVGTAAWREGPEEFAYREEWTAAASVRAKVTKNTTLLVEAESAGLRGNAAPEIPATRETRGAKIGGPHLPLADFNSNGPDASSGRLSQSLSTIVEHNTESGLIVRGVAEWWGRTNEEHRFSTGAFLLDQRVFDGVREPEFTERDDESVGMQFEIDGRLRLERSDHRWVVGVEASRAEGERTRRMLPRSARDQLPLSVSRLDPLDPDYSLTPYSPDVYSRIVSQRTETTDYQAVFLGDRFSLARGRFSGTAGVRYDWVDAEVTDLRSGEMTTSTGSSGRTTYHAGLVGVLNGGRLAWYLNTSTAFQPQRKIDARTGRILANESTTGFESGVRWEGASKRLTVNGNLFRLFNSDIVRPNPFYDDPVLDPDRTQPQLVASGEERFTGAEATIRWSPEPFVTLSAKGTVLEAITTRSPDLPEEVGRQLTRQPKLTGGLSARVAVPAGTWKGAALQASLTWVGPHTVTYEDSRRLGVAYGSYAVVNLSADYGWKAPRRQHTIGVAVRNLLDRDLPAATGKRGGDLGLEMRYRLKI